MFLALTQFTAAGCQADRANGGFADAAATDHTGDGSDTDSDAGAPVPKPLVDNTKWQLLAPEEDPFWSMRPDAYFCDATAHTVEQSTQGEVLEVRTDLCNYITLTQPSLLTVSPGDSVEIVLWHNTLAQTEPAAAVAALLLAGETIWTEIVPIPGSARSYAATWRAQSQIPEGSPVMFHIHNHGNNSWKLAEVTAVNSPAPIDGDCK